jgi:hypothetical protein
VAGHPLLDRLGVGVPQQRGADAPPGVGARGNQQQHVQLWCVRRRDVGRGLAEDHRPGGLAADLGNPQAAAGRPRSDLGDPLGLGQERLGSLLAAAAGGGEPAHGAVQHGQDRTGVLGPATADGQGVHRVRSGEGVDGADGGVDVRFAGDDAGAEAQVTSRSGSFTPVPECTQVSASTRVRGPIPRRTAATSPSTVTAAGSS